MKNKPVFWFLAVFLMLGLLEAGLQIASRISPPRKKISFAPQPLSGPSAPLSLPDAGRENYQMTDPQNPQNWVLIPGYQITLGQVLANVEQISQPGTGKPLRYDASFIKIQQMKAQALRQFMRQKGLTPEHYFLRVNRLGLKGPEILKSKTPGTLRIMTIGDSCTFGGLEDFCYPRVLERELRKQGEPVEVINAGVQGYAPANVLSRLPYFLSLKPDLVTVYLGWNAVPGSSGEPQSYLERIILWRTISHFRRAYLPPKPGEENLNYYRPQPGYHYHPAFLPQMESIVREIKAQGIKPVLLTLPVLYSAKTPPPADTFNLTHPAYGGNLYLFAAKIRDYNQALRKLAVQEHIPLIDLESWGEANLIPGKKYYSDSIHLNDSASEKLGIYLARELLPLLKQGGKP